MEPHYRTGIQTHTHSRHIRTVRMVRYLGRADASPIRAAPWCIVRNRRA